MIKVQPCGVYFKWFERSVMTIKEEFMQLQYMLTKVEIV